MHPGEAAAAEKIVNGKASLGADAEYGSVLVGSRPQVGNGAQKFVGMAFFLQRKIFGVGQAVNLHVMRAHLPLLPFARRGYKFARHAHGSACGRIAEALMGRRTRVHDALHVGEAGTVVDFHKAEILGVAACAYPATQDYGGLGRCGVESVDNQGSLHGRLLGE